MNFRELEIIMTSYGVNSLADIARALNTTPQAVSNWKSRDQVPFHIVSKINNKFTADSSSVVKEKQSYPSPLADNKISPNIFEGDDTFSLSDILLTLSEQLKVIILIPIITGFFTFTYIQFIEEPLYNSSATILLPEAMNDASALSSIASQFGVGIPEASAKSLSSPSLFPELIKSRTFAERIFNKYFYTDLYGVELPLLAILSYGDKEPQVGRDTLIQMSLGAFQNMVTFSSNESFSILTVTANEPLLAKTLNKVVLDELQELNRYFRTQSVNEKIIFIESRLKSVDDDLKRSEQTLKSFRENNRQVSSPALQLEQERLTRDVEIQKEIFLTLKQQKELAKIEEVQEASIIQVLDEPQVALYPSNKNLTIKVGLAIILGLSLGVLLGFVRAYYNNKNIDERKKLRRVKNFIKKNSKNVFMDKRIILIIIIMQFSGMPFYLGYQSMNPVFFGMYSMKLMVINTLYILTLILLLVQLIRIKQKRIGTKN
jgi:uncharacterized protein involved in exopolysaccharide biosynthesis